MSKRFKRRKEEVEEFNIWPSFTDLMSNAVMILTLFLFLALFRAVFLKYVAQETEETLSENVTVLQQQIGDLKTQLSQSNQELTEAKGEVRRLNRVTNELNQYAQSRNEIIAELETQILQLENESTQLEDQIVKLKLAPPVLVIQDSGEYRFQSGSAQLPQQLSLYIEQELVPKIENIARERDIYVIEIIGHTDGQIINGNSNLDANLEEVAKGQKSVNILRPGSNADLGLLRALEVIKKLQEVQKRGRLQGLEFRAYSAAQLFLPSGGFASANRQPDATRRRIEIRFSPLGKAETIR